MNNVLPTCQPRNPSWQYPYGNKVRYICKRLRRTSHCMILLQVFFFFLKKRKFASFSQVNLERNIYMEHTIGHIIIQVKMWLLTSLMKHKLEKNESFPSVKSMHLVSRLWQVNSVSTQRSACLRDLSFALLFHYKLTLILCLKCFPQAAPDTTDI